MVNKSLVLINSKSDQHYFYKKHFKYQVKQVVQFGLEAQEC